MKPRNFPGHKARRQAAAKRRRGEPLGESETSVLQQPKDIRILVGRSKR